MEKRLLLAFILSFAVLYGFRFIMPTPPAAPKAVVEKTETPPAPPPAVPEPVTPPTDGEVTVQADAPKDHKIENDLYIATLSNVGGVLKSFRLKEYVDEKDEPSELINPYAGEKIGLPLAIATADPALNKTLSAARFVFELGGDPAKVSLEYRFGGVHARKSLEFNPTKYLVTISTSLERNGLAVPHQVVMQGGFGDQSVVPEVPAMKNAVYQGAGKFERLNLLSFEEGVAQDHSSAMVGVEDQYFLAMFILPQAAGAKVSKSTFKLPNNPDGTEGAAASALHVAVPSTAPMQMYIGPKLEKTLAAAHPALGSIPNFGWFLFALLAKPLLVVLNWLYAFIGNYGFAIIILTLLVNLLLFPLRVKQQVTMQRMQKNAPQMRTLQDKYKKLKPGDPKRAEVEKELMEMNKQQLAGCMPMLLQMPVFFAFLNMMNAAIELRGAPWMLWLQDLSKPDHLYILPILMGVAMFIQMKMSPTSPDPAQAKIMLITPVLVTLLFLWYASPSGLTLYWLTGNVIGIVQQWIIKNYWTDDNAGKPRRRKPLPA